MHKTVIVDVCFFDRIPGVLVSPMKIPFSRTYVGATGRSPARGHWCGGGRPAGRPYVHFHSLWRAAGSRKLGGENGRPSSPPRHQDTKNRILACKPRLAFNVQVKYHEGSILLGGAWE